MKLCVLVCAIVAATESVKLPSNFKTCNRKQANFRGCLLQAARHALTQLNRPYDDLKMPTLDPLYVKRIETSVHTLLFNVTSELTECQLYNLLHLNVEQFDVDFEGKTIQMSAYWPYQKSRCFQRGETQVLFTDVWLKA
ncbi:hypothetical protein Zmor_016868 [Zophobas morio]|uniref:Uncharacterized protein n=1 Tax=Zophobas morio TaxID=2755281 RepID=A0AA38IBF8_9CUCU|nr:hypothetical protein Zmor_016868 [Zophobas morio]